MTELDSITNEFLITISSQQDYHLAILDIARDNDGDLGATAEALEDYFYDTAIEEHDDPNRLYSNILLMGFKAIDWRAIATHAIESQREIDSHQ